MTITAITPTTPEPADVDRASLVYLLGVRIDRLKEAIENGDSWLAQDELTFVVDMGRSLGVFPPGACQPS